MRRSARALALVAALSITAAGCGADDEASSKGASPEAEEEPAAERSVARRARTVLPAEARRAGNEKTLDAGDSAHEVQEAVATWAYERGAGKRPWFPRKVLCDEPASPDARRWTCDVTFVTPDDFGREADLVVELRARGAWTGTVRA